MGEMDKLINAFKINILEPDIFGWLVLWNGLADLSTIRMGFFFKQLHTN